jgi:hypothetical protein
MGPEFILMQTRVLRKSLNEPTRPRNLKKRFALSGFNKFALRTPIKLSEVFQESKLNPDLNGNEIAD